MFNLNSILREIQDIPQDRLEDLYSFVHSLNPKTKKSDKLRRAILSYAGAFSDMTKKDYADFIKQTRRARTKLFDRKFDL